MTATCPTPTRSPRGCWWLSRPTELPDGRLLGFVGIRVGREKSFYRAVRVEADDFCETWFVEKENLNGTFAPGYTVCLPTGGNRGRSNCTCPAGRYQRTCRHSLALTALSAA